MKRHEPIAIVGIGGLFPHAHNPDEFWDNILRMRDCMEELKENFGYWKGADHFDPNPLAVDKTYARRAAYIPEIDFDPIEYGIPPKQIETISLTQLFALVVAKQALADARLLAEQSTPEARDRVGVILGVGGTGNTGIKLGARADHKEWERTLRNLGYPEDEVDEMVRRLRNLYVEWQESSFPGLLANVVAGRITNRFDLGGTNCTVDAACAASLAALKMAVLELQSGSCDAVLTGGVNVENSIFAFLCFSKTPALSQSGVCRPFDEKADGMMLGDGVGMYVLKRLADAQANNDRIYAVIDHVGASSDGRFNSIYAPRWEGQIKALERAYADSTVEPGQISLVEAHGTGTRSGDVSEFQAINGFFSNHHVQHHSIALGSVKSQIGHTRIAAGAASVIKTSLALYHRILPPTINVSTPNPKLGLADSAFYLNTRSRPWFAKDDGPLAAGVNAFGFGGSNYHVILKEAPNARLRPPLKYPYHTVVLSAPNRASLIEQCKMLLAAARDGESLFHSALNRMDQEIPTDHCRIGWVADGEANSVEILARACGLLESDLHKLAGDPDLHFRDKAVTAPKVAVLFPGQASQYVEMGVELAIYMPAVYEAFEQANRLCRAHGVSSITDVVFPVPAGDPAEKEAQRDRLSQTEHAQLAIAALSMGTYQQLCAHGLEADVSAGHSLGEFVALWAMGKMGGDSLLECVFHRGRLMAAACEEVSGGMLSVFATAERLVPLLECHPDIHVCNYNAENQLVVGGTKAALTAFRDTLAEQRITSVELAVAGAFHTPLMATASERFAPHIHRTAFSSSEAVVYANLTGKPYPASAEALKAMLTEQMTGQVRFHQTVRQMLDDGIDIFVEVGPKAVLSKLVAQIAKESPHAVHVVTTNAGTSGDDLRQYCQALVKLKCLGLPVKLPVDRTTVSAPKRGTIRLDGGNYYGPEAYAARHASLHEEHPIHRPQQQTAHVATQRETMMDLRPAPLPAEATTNEESFSTGQRLAAFNQTYLQFQENQALYIQTLKQIVDDQTALIRQRPDLPGDVLSHFRKTLGAVESSYTQYHRIQEQYLSIQAELLVGGTMRLPTESGTLPSSASITGLQATTPKPYPPASDMAPIAEAKPKEVSTPRVIESSSPPTAPAVAPPASAEALAEIVLKIICDVTGYDPDGIHMEMSLEADLGIDSIKRIEIVTALQEQFPDVSIEMTQLAEIRTLRDVSLLLGQPPSLATGTEVPQQPEPKPVDVMQKVVDVICEITGYDRDGLRMEMDLEADLGIDSIKRVQILSALEEHFPDLSVDVSMGDLRTLADVARLAQGAEAVPVVQAHAKEPTIDAPTGPSLFRQDIALQPLPRVQRVTRDLKRQPVVICTADDTGLAVEIGAAVEEMNGLPVFLSMDETLADESACAAALQSFRDTGGAITGIIVVMPEAKPVAEMEACFDPSLIALLKTSFLLAKAVKKDLVDRAPAFPLFVAVTRSDGQFLRGESERNGLPLSVSGLVKSLAHEWPGVFCRMIDLDVAMTGAQQRDAIGDELCDLNRKRPAVARGIDCRHSLAPHISEPLATPHSNRTPSADEVILVTGGGRGVTAACIRALAKQCRARYVLLGRTRLEDSRPTWREGGDPAQWRRAIKAALEAKGVAATPVLVEREVRRYEEQLEIRETLDALSALDCEATYLPCDITDASSVKEALAGIGTVKWLIHGAGTLADKKIEDKSPANFDSVFGTKVVGLGNLLRHLELSVLEKVVLFSSVAGFFGNAGQTDYAMANEALNYLAQTLGNRHPALDIVSMGWGPWDHGMMNDALKKLYAQAGITLIPRQMGVEAFVHECLGTHAEAACLYSGILSLPGATREVVRPFEFEACLQLAENPYLSDHTIAGQPVLPATFALGWIFQIAQDLYPDYHIHRVTDFKVFKGVVFADEKGFDCLISATPLSPADGMPRVQISIKTRSSKGEATPRYVANVELSVTPPQPLVLPEWEQGRLELSADDYYERNVLFHTGVFHGIDTIRSLDDRHIEYTLSAPSLGPDAIGTFSVYPFDPYVADICLQGMLILLHEHFDTLGLPLAIQALQLDPRPTHPRRSDLSVRIDVVSVSANLAVFDARLFESGSRRPLLQMEGVRTSLSKALRDRFGVRQPGEALARRIS